MQIVTPEHIKRLEDRSEKLGVTKKQLMLNAGKALAELIDDCCRSRLGLAPEECPVVFLAGTGNNGGDCFAAADILVYKGYDITMIHAGGMPGTPLAMEMLQRLPMKRIRFIEGFRSFAAEAAIEAAELSYMTEPRSSEAAAGGTSAASDAVLKEKRRAALVRAAISGAKVLVDGVFGTGFHGELSEDIAALFAAGGSSSVYRIAVDAPSGGSCATGEASAGCFRADETLCFGYMKAGMTQYPLREYCGRIKIADIGIPAEAAEILEGERNYYSISRSFPGSFPVARAAASHKGSFGTVLVIAGSSAMRGAAAFAALGALRSGAGLVRIASTEKCIDTVSVLVPEATYIELESDDYGYMLFDSSRNALLQAMEKADAVVIGCGMGVTSDTAELTKFVAENAKCPVIIDADGINCISSDIDILLKKRTDIIITPHPGEMARLLGCEASVISGNRLAAAEKYAEKYGITVVLKGAGTIVADSRRTAVNHTGNPGMSVGGSGDVLAGIIGAAVAQGAAPFDSACVGVYIHGLAGDKAAERLGMEAMLPRDIIGSLSEAFRSISSSDPK